MTILPGLADFHINAAAQRRRLAGGRGKAAAAAAAHQLNRTD
jgi:hypothetical protein